MQAPPGYAYIPNGKGGFDLQQQTHDKEGQLPNAYDPTPKKRRGTVGKIGKAVGRVADSVLGAVAGLVGGAVVGAGTFAATGMATGLTGLATNPTSIQMGYEGRNFGVSQEEFMVPSRGNIQPQRQQYAQPPSNQPQWHQPKDENQQVPSHSTDKETNNYYEKERVEPFKSEQV